MGLRFKLRLAASGAEVLRAAGMRRAMKRSVRIDAHSANGVADLVRFGSFAARLHVLIMIVSMSGMVAAAA